MSGATPCQERPPGLAGGPARARPWTPSTAAAAAEVASETWLDAVWAAAGLLDDGAGGPAPACDDQFCLLGSSLQDDAPAGEDQLSTQLFRNNQLRDILVQKEVELARLQEENHHLRQFLNSALVKRLEETTKKLLRQNSQDVHGAFRTGKRPLKAESRVAPEVPHPQKARRNLLGDFAACKEQPGPPVDPWVLQTLGLKDVDTVDESANHRASTSDFAAASSLGAPPPGATDVGEGQPAVDRCAMLTLPLDSTASSRGEALPFLLQVPDLTCQPPGHSYVVSPAHVGMAFTTSLSPHCNVKTHTFRQGQAFVRRDEDGGWKLTWVPKQLE